MPSTDTEGEAMEDFTGLASPESLPFDLAQASLARSLPLAVFIFAIGATTNPYLQEFLDNPANGDILPALGRFQRWSDDNVAIAGLDAWLGYLADSRAVALKNLWDAYDPGNLVEEIVRDTAGDEVLGAALWFSYLADVGVISGDDESRWCNLWDFFIVEDLFVDEDDEDGEEKDEGDHDATGIPTEEDEW